MMIHSKLPGITRPQYRKLVKSQETFEWTCQGCHPAPPAANTTSLSAAPSTSLSAASSNNISRRQFHQPHRRQLNQPLSQLLRRQLSQYLRRQLKMTASIMTIQLKPHSMCLWHQQYVNILSLYFVMSWK